MSQNSSTPSSARNDRKADAQLARRSVLFIVHDDQQLTATEALVRDRLEWLGYEVEPLQEQATKKELYGKTSGKILIFISPNADNGDLGKRLREIETPIVVASNALFETLRLTKEQPAEIQPERINEALIVNTEAARNHPLAGRLSGRVRFSEQPVALVPGRPEGKAVRIVSLINSAQQVDGTPTQCLIFGYETGEYMVGLNAPARRVAFGLLPHDTVNSKSPFKLTDRGAMLFDAVIGWATAEQAKAFDRVYRREWKDVERRRIKQRYAAEVSRGDATASARDASSPKPPEMPPPFLTGVAFSGGGIRSATFSLGVLQQLEKAGWVRLFDYLSTVSGGGFTGGWWSGWLARGRRELPEALLQPDDAAEKSKGKTLPGWCNSLAEWRDKFVFDPAQVPHASEFLARLRANDPIDLFPDLRACLPDAATGEQQAFDALNDYLFGTKEKPSCLRGIYDREKFTRAKVALTHTTFTLAQREFASGESAAECDVVRLMQLNRLLLEEVYPRELGYGFFPPEEELEPVRDVTLQHSRRVDVADRTPHQQPTQSEATEFNDEAAPDLLAAGHDPLHHLRLFSNYLVPRRGLLSADTWGALTYLTRNIGLTWLILLPILLVLLLLGQLYFLVGCADSIKCLKDTAPLLGAHPFQRAGYLLSLLAGWMLTLGAVYVAVAGRADQVDGGRGWHNWWRQAREPQWWTHWLSLAALGITGLLVGLAVRARSAGRRSWQDIPRGWEMVILLFVLGVAVLLFTTMRVTDDATERGITSRPTVRRNQITRANAAIFMSFVLAAAVLAVAGCGPWLVEKMITPQGGWLSRLIAQGGGLSAVLMAAASAIYTAIKRAPAGGGDARYSQPSLLGQLTLKLAPPLVILVLAVASSWATWHLIRWISEEAATGTSKALLVVTCVGLLLSLFLTLAETSWNRPLTFRLLFSGWLGLVAWGLAALLDYGVCTGRESGGALWGLGSCSNQHWKFSALSGNYRALGWALLACALLTGFLLLWRFLGFDPQHRGADFWRETAALFAKWALGCGVIGLLIEFGRWRYQQQIVSWRSFDRFLGYAIAHTSQLPFAPPSLFSFQVLAGLGLVFCLMVAATEAFFSRRYNQRARYLLTGVYVAFATLLLLGMTATAGAQDTWANRPSVVALALIGALLTLVLALGWAADPNLLSLHLFYRMRLVRGYLGASNRRRASALKDVSQAVLGDDILLKDLQNCERGAPYHLINTALNMTGGSDLGTAQRRVAHFLLSRHYCGSSRTGYRDTREYMGGRLSLGAAMAISGAAATPSVASVGTTAAQGMLLTLLNVRLGFWAPTPNKDYWQEPQARLWPFLTLREFLSQTNDLGSHCYLSDGAHFNNTGIYALVERGCRLILATDCGADPETRFGDVGELVRRCRIDFGAKIKLDVRPLFRDPKRLQVEAHFVVGEIEYSEAHLRTLNYTDPKQIKEASKGWLVLFKPGLTGREAVDVLQYGIEHEGKFPQQTTGDQFFDEAQFESYRRLGEESAAAFLADFRQQAKSVSENLAAGNSIDRSTLKRIYEGVANLTNPVGVAAERARIAAEELNRLTFTEVDLDGTARWPAAPSQPANVRNE